MHTKQKRAARRRAALTGAGASVTMGGIYWTPPAGPAYRAPSYTVNDRRAFRHAAYCAYIRACAVVDITTLSDTFVGIGQGMDVTAALRTHAAVTVRQSPPDGWGGDCHFLPCVAREGATHVAYAPFRASVAWMEQTTWPRFRVAAI